jgi:RNA polymerase sigma factor (sigma-70 family)
MSFGSESSDRPAGSDDSLSRAAPRRDVLVEHPLLRAELQDFELVLDAWCRRVARPPYTAEDVEQQVKCTMLERAASVEAALAKRADHGWRRAYLCLYAKSIWLDMRRTAAVWTRDWKQVDPVDLDDARAGRHESLNELIEAAQRDEHATRVRHAIDELHDERWRIIVTRHGLEKVSHAEVARELGMTVGTERSYYARALDELASRLRGLEDELE